MRPTRPILFWFVLICSLFVGRTSAQTTPPDLFLLQVYPSLPSTTDSVFVSLTYTSNDGCPDYVLHIDSVEPSMVAISVRKIDQSKSICTQMVSKFVTKVNLGPLLQPTRIYVNSNLLQTVVPGCTMNRKGLVVAGTGACVGKLLLKEHSMTASAVVTYFSLDRAQAKRSDGKPFTGFRVGDEVTFAANLLATTALTYNPCPIVGYATCCEVTGSLPDCALNRKGVVVKGIDGCTGKWLIKDLSPVYSYPRMYVFQNDGSYQAGDVLLFGAEDYPSDSARSILCPIYGEVRCYVHKEPILPDTLAGTAYTGDSILKGGTAILLQKGIRKALRAVALKNGRFEFTNLPLADYTVYVIPERMRCPDYLPTFYINKLAYRNADYVTLQEGRNELAVNLRKFVKPTGTGKIYGNVYFETANLKDSILHYYGDKNYLYTTENNTAVNLPVILFNQSGNPIAWTVSDENGNYTFEGIAPDTYRIVSETAETSAETSVSLSGENASIGADMVLKVVSSVDGTPEIHSQTMDLYPNPTSQVVHVTTGKAELLRLYDSLGRLAMECRLLEGENLVDIHVLQSGLYLVKIGTRSQKLLIRPN